MSTLSEKLKVIKRIDQKLEMYHKLCYEKKEREEKAQKEYDLQCIENFKKLLQSGKKPRISAREFNSWDITSRRNETANISGEFGCFICDGFFEYLRHLGYHI